MYLGIDVHKRYAQDTLARPRERDVSHERASRVVDQQISHLRHGKPRRRRGLPDCLRDLRSLSVYDEEDVTFFVSEGDT